MATTYLSPIGNSAQINANGAPLSGGQIWTYAAGTTTPIATYMDNSGAVGQQNPIPLNASGLPANPIWLPAGQAVKLVIQDAFGVTQRTVDNVTGINDPTAGSAVSEWTAFTGSPTYVSATSFSVAGDQTNVLQPGRRVKTANSGGTVYSTISASSYNGGTGRTSLTISNDNSSLDSGLSSVSYGLLSATNPSLPGLLAAKTSSGYQKLPTGVIVQWGTTTMSSGGIATNFPIPFPTVLLHAGPIHLGTTPGAPGSVSYTASTSAITIYCSNAGGPFNCTYFAIGV